MGDENNNRKGIEQLLEYFPKEHVGFVVKKYSPKQIDFIMSHLTRDEMHAVRDPEDYLTAAEISHMPLHRWKMYEERFEILDLSHYNASQRQWLMDKKMYLKKELGREPTQDEFGERIGDIEHIGLRNRVLYIFKYMSDKSKIKPKNALLSD